MAVLSLRCCVGFFSSCSEQGLLSSCSARDSRGAQALECAGFSSWSSWAQYLWPMGLVTLQHVGSSPSRDQNRVSCVGKWILYH